MKITLPDNSSRELPEGSSGYDLAKDIGPGLAKSAVAVSVNGVQRDLHDVIEGAASVSIITKFLFSPFFTRITLDKIIPDSNQN